MSWVGVGFTGDFGKLCGLTRACVFWQGTCAPFMGELMRVALKERICDQVLAKLNRSYKERSELLCRILQTEPGITIHNIPLGGYFIWVSFEGIDNTSDLLAFCQTKGVNFLAGERCGSFVQDNDDDNGWEGAWCRRSARFCFADLDVADLEAGAKRLIDCYQEYMTSREGKASNL